MKLFHSRVLALTAILLIATQLVIACAPAAAHAGSQQPTALPVAPTVIVMPAVAPAASGIDPLVFRETVRKLWEEHITWTRVYIIAAVAGLPETDTAAARLLQNQTDIGNAIKPFYGDAAGEQLTALLRDHILTAADLVAAAKAGDAAKVQAASTKWYANADQIAGFLSNANPGSWPLSDMQTMMKNHLDLTLGEATARLHQDWPADIAAYDNVHTEILQMADMLSAGIIAQFPDKFAPLTESPKAVALTLAMNKLWEDHVTWTRTYIMSVTSDLPDVNAAAGRLLQNQVDIGDAIKPLYGDAAGAQLTAFLKDHILTAPEHLEEWFGYGAFFVIVAAAQFAFPLLLRFRKLTRSLLFLGLVANLLMLMLYLLPRTAAIPLGPHAGLLRSALHLAYAEDHEAPGCGRNWPTEQAWGRRTILPAVRLELKASPRQVEDSLELMCRALPAPRRRHMVGPIQLPKSLM